MSVIWEPQLDEDGRRWRDLARNLSAERFAPLAEELDRDQRYPWESVKALVESGLAGLFVGREYGGQGASFVTTCAVIEEVSRACASTGAILTAYALGGTPLVLAGTPEQQRKYLGGMAAGQAVSFALTEEGAGSDAARIRTTAVREGDGWRIKGEKIYIGNGGASQHYVVFALTDPQAGTRGITAFMVDKDAEGVTIDRYEDKMGIRGTQTSNLKLDTWVADDEMLGQLNKGMRLAMLTLNAGRISVAAQSLGVALAGYDVASTEAVRRQTFGRPIIDNQGISFPLADIATGITAARMITFEAARVYQDGGDVSVLGAMAKLHASEVAHTSVDTAVQVYGGAGFCKPCPAERLYRDQRILEIYEGTSEIQRLVLGRAIKASVTA
ncbi:acyl-CoA dehydrogenase family protein [Micromonospora sp. 4G57]|uniref:Acyl-CoA dehydrogenase family protein n=1 Tax=Micromonospora sicca TaxID=2202420 RepID=A0ABU5JLE1_9ACTN|nr:MULTISPECIES: acyl-CoA dehydrogenase family protein [unclassified Micromonospora]MDZ5446373.1 acyl-CoA dehydrogenase family protein [Micromonospora sp. 4G57]MDZ5493438.1 acyl-CoA dehydrogenase family protein [Micromonospora sp. 4G53]